MRSLPPTIEAIAALIRNSQGDDLLQRVATLEANADADSILFEERQQSQNAEILGAVRAELQPIIESIRTLRAEIRVGISDAENNIREDLDRWQATELPRRVREILDEIKVEQERAKDREIERMAVLNEEQRQQRKDRLFWALTGLAALGWILYGYQQIIVERRPEEITNILRGRQACDP